MSPQATGLVERLLGPHPRPDDLDILTESTEGDDWAPGPTPGGLRGSAPRPRPDDLDTVTKTVECDRWTSSAPPRPRPRPRPDDLGEQTASLEADGWNRHAMVRSGPKPVPPGDLDILTHTDDEGDAWVG